METCRLVQVSKLLAVCGNCTNMVQVSQRLAWSSLAPLWLSFVRKLMDANSLAGSQMSTFKTKGLRIPKFLTCVLNVFLRHQLKTRSN